MPLDQTLAIRLNSKGDEPVGELPQQAVQRPAGESLVGMGVPSDELHRGDVGPGFLAQGAGGGLKERQQHW
ncbi:MAG: hypothetical protein GEU90_08130 [Gemmatimonas sp.]|nr:hypothetical protein [Gemmatimonas sp.]